MDSIKTTLANKLYFTNICEAAQKHTIRQMLSLPEKLSLKDNLFVPSGFCLLPGRQLSGELNASLHPHSLELFVGGNTNKWNNAHQE